MGPGFGDFLFVMTMVSLFESKGGCAPLTFRPERGHFIERPHHPEVVELVAPDRQADLAAEPAPPHRFTIMEPPAEEVERASEWKDCQRRYRVRRGLSNEERGRDAEWIGGRSIFQGRFLLHEARKFRLYSTLTSSAEQLLR